MKVRLKFLVQLVADGLHECFISYHFIILLCEQLRLSIYKFD